MIFESIHKHVIICDHMSLILYRKLFRDVLPSIGTVASVKLMVDLILSGSIPQSDSEWWLETIAFHPKPSAEMISTFMVILHEFVNSRAISKCLLRLTDLLTCHLQLLTKADPPSSKVLLSLSALMNSYCQKFTNCSSSDHIRDFIGILKSRLGLNCNFQKQQDIEEVFNSHLKLYHISL